MMVASSILNTCFAVRSQYVQRMAHGHQRLTPAGHITRGAVGQRDHLCWLRAEHEHAVQVEGSHLLPWLDAILVARLLGRRHQADVCLSHRSGSGLS